ncbi:MAG: hypothetical protein ACQEXI_14760 [Pseudomonadota bacterium]
MLTPRSLMMTLLCSLPMASAAQPATLEDITIELDGAPGVSFEAEWRISGGSADVEVHHTDGEVPRTLTFRGSALQARIVKGPEAGALNVTIIKGGNRSRQTLNAPGGRVNLSIQ